MGKFYLPSKGAAAWRAYLARPETQWQTGFSARTLAHCWEHAGELPAEVATVLQQIGTDPELLIALAEHKTPLPGSSRGESQSDIFALVRAGAHTLAVTIEGKVDESFGLRLGEWLDRASKGKQARLKFIAELLQLDLPIPGEVHYQLLHRTASAIIEARRFKTDAAVMLVHSFSRQRKWLDAFRRFTALFGRDAEPGKLVEL